MSEYRYPWPASALAESDMALLFRVREASPKRTTITQLIADAVHAAYGAPETVQFQPTNIRRLHEAKEPDQEEFVSQNPAA